MSFNAALALFIISNFPSLLIGMLAARSMSAAMIYGAAMKGGIILLLALLGGGASATTEEKMASAALAIVGGAVSGNIGYAFRTLWHGKRKFGEFFATIFAALLWLSLASAYVYAMWKDARSGSFGFFIADLVVPPFGILRGLALYLGLL